MSLCLGGCDDNTVYVAANLAALALLDEAGERSDYTRPLTETRGVSRQLAGNSPMPCSAAFERNTSAEMDGTVGEMMSSRQWLSEQLECGRESPGVLLLDCRAPNDYNASHVVGALHVAIPPLLLRRLKKGNLAVSTVISGNEGRDQFALRCRDETLIVYDDSSSETNVNPTGVAWLLLKKLRADGYRARMLNAPALSTVRTRVDVVGVTLLLLLL
ncbi:hypothetical protein NP493_162g05020 [Ridgeia piscesae]|uniref:Rhodanese domain-containing protein n=1 Tax=Ridgeia piscesae TaxID=27915 RepID=A0AAD9UFK8_RIDPI|nr:hypothetical protein NP493_162g05020 [Ridgeia piscesae]